MNPHLDQALHSIRASSSRYARFERYYRGDHDLAFATEKFQTAFGSLFREFALNLCPAICDAIVDKLKDTGFSWNADAPVRTSEDHASPDVARAAARIWHLNRMPIRSDAVHLEAVLNGDAYVVVWPAPDGRPVIYPQRASSCIAVYDDEMPGVIRWGAKHWHSSDGRTRLNLLYPDRIEKYVSRHRVDDRFLSANDPAGIQTGAGSTVTTLPVSASSFELASVIANPYGVVPLFHFANGPGIGSFGRSELLHAIPIQNGLNKAVLDMLVAMEFSAYRQRWVTGMHFDTDEDTGRTIEPFRTGVDRIWIAPETGARFGDFGTTDLDQFLLVKDSFRVDMASVTGTPLHYFLQNIRGFASGESIRKSEGRFLAKVRDRQTSFGHVWAEVVSFALQIAGLAPAIELAVQWEDPAPVAEREFLENIILKKRIGITTGQALKEAGYGDTHVTEMIDPDRQKHDR